MRAVRKDPGRTWMMIALSLFAGGLAGCFSSPLQAGNSLVKAPSTSPATLPPEEPTLTATSLPDTPTVLAIEGEGGDTEIMTITIVYDNYPYRAGLGTAWGFAAVVEFRDHLVLFDTGGSGSLLLSNLAAVGVEPGDIQAVVLSHEHNDHTGGLQSLLNAGADPVIYIPPSFSAAFKSQFGSRSRLVESKPGTRIAERLYTTGEIQGPPPEQALVIDTPDGLVVITGCAHPGVDKMILEAKRQYQEDIYLVLGGFHLGNASDARITGIIKEFKRLGVKIAAPCHCTGDHAIGLFKNAFGEDFLGVGVGAVIEIEI